LNGRVYRSATTTLVAEIGIKKYVLNILIY
jgi:hypothetical protein